MKKICLSRQTAGYLLTTLRGSTHPSLPSLAAAIRAEKKGKSCTVCATYKHNIVDLFQALFKDVKMAVVKGEGSQLQEFFNKCTNNDFTTRWEFVFEGERVCL